jgi:hypothetical protein
MHTAYTCIVSSNLTASAKFERKSRCKAAFSVSGAINQKTRCPDKGSGFFVLNQAVA